jgi:hypothetical protein
MLSGLRILSSIRSAQCEPDLHFAEKCMGLLDHGVVAARKLPEDLSRARSEMLDKERENHVRASGQVLDKDGSSSSGNLDVDIVTFFQIGRPTFYPWFLFSSGAEIIGWAACDRN